MLILLELEVVTEQILVLVPILRVMRVVMARILVLLPVRWATEVESARMFVVLSIRRLAMGAVLTLMHAPVLKLWPP